jgi:hypothetical protein
MDGSERDDLDRRGMAEQATVKVWTIPAYEGSGPVTMTLRVPDVRISDSEGRFIIISPRQSAIVGSRLESINDWLQYGDEGEAM